MLARLVHVKEYSNLIFPDFLGSKKVFFQRIFYHSVSWVISENNLKVLSRHSAEDNVFIPDGNKGKSV